MSKKYVVHIIPYFASIVSGPSHSVWNLFDKTADISYEIWALDWGNNARENERIRFFKKIFWWRLGFSIEYINAIRQLMKDKNAIIHNHGMWMIQSLFPLFVREVKATIIQSPRGALSPLAMKQGGLLKRMFWILLQRRALKKVNYFHATSLAEKYDIEKLGFKQKIKTIPNGVEVRDIKVYRESNKYIYLGRFHIEKNLEMLLDCWSEFDGNNVLDLYGEGNSSEIAYLLAKIKERKLRNVRINPPVFGKEKIKHLASSRALLFPSLSENFAIVIAEALSVGTPVICTLGTPWKEIHMKAGYCVKGVPADFTKAIKDIVSLGDTEYQKYSMNARRLIEMNYTWDKIAVTYIRWIYDEM